MIEKVIFQFGFGLTCFFFMLMLGIGSQFIWGFVVGLIVMGIGSLLWNE